jgi:ribose transport system permease protein
MTLSMASVVQGITLVYTQGQPKGRASMLLSAAGSGRTGPFPNILLVWIIIIAAALIVLEKTRTGRLIYGVGENRKTAELSGVRTRRTSMLVFGFSGLISALAGFFLLGYTGTAYLDLGSAYIMPTIAAAVIGGVVLSGGTGSYLGAAAGTIVLTTLNSIMISLKSGEGGRQIVYGLVILVVLTIYSKRERR